MDRWMAKVVLKLFSASKTCILKSREVSGGQCYIQTAWVACALKIAVETLLSVNWTLVLTYSCFEKVCLTKV